MVLAVCQIYLEAVQVYAGSNGEACQVCASAFRCAYLHLVSASEIVAQSKPKVLRYDTLLSTVPATLVSSPSWVFLY